MTAFDTDAATAREDLCRFLAACYYEPALEFSEERLFDSVRGAARRVDPALAEIALRLGPGFEAQSLEALLVDYTRLFLGPIEQLARPYGSFWLTEEKSPSEDPAMAVQDLYEKGGFDIDDEFQELPDHVAVELEFLYLLIFKQNEAHRAGREAELTGLQALQSQFLSQHLGAWIAFRGGTWPVTIDPRLPQSLWTCSVAGTFDEDTPWVRCHAVALRRGVGGDLRSACAYLSTLKLNVPRKLMWLEWAGPIRRSHASSISMPPLRRRSTTSFIRFVFHAITMLVSKACEPEIAFISSRRRPRSAGSLPV